ncbi:Lipase maturation factor 2 [Seminavis robusta]|uniref:Lipase maturation factor 2 n=1 Tax=Seminavis robusta TaxID=568900 RepID=A0A9N8F3N6_9STRA|nr:Lipase maturation factor 2 [Seminavis robusta]|eukprot:Sro2682_g334500.1 Lipase maturation factor 2 (699) ;mRNA; r:4598-6694
MTTLKPPKPTHQYQYSYRSLYLSAIGWIQLIAYWSYYVQFPGLLSSSGIEPVHRVFSRAAPSLHQAWIQSGQKIDEDSLCELLALSGMILAALIASGWCQHAVLFAANVAIYGLLVRTGGTFYSFQWDTLLLETTTVTCLTYAPWWRFRPVDNDQSPVAAIPLRFLLFKLMFMSGIVKLQAHCPTWEHLTALEYHFATQCLPGPLAWHAHQLHPFLLRLGVAITLWIELPATLLLVLPLKSVRRVGALLQLSLQVLIILTGNYNFFNLLTMALCIPVWEEEEQQNNNNNTDDARANKKQTTTTILWVLVEQLFCWTFLLGTFFSMFRIVHVGPDQNLNIVLLQDSMWIQPQVFLPWVPGGTLVLIAVTTLVTTTTPRPSKIFHGLVCFLVVGIVALPIFHQIPLGDNQTLRPGPWFRTYIQPYWLVHGYGLFRRMTGVGTVPRGATGWAGLPPSAVARPEIILEGLFAVDNDEGEKEWHELDMFRWKPGAVNAMPRQMAPHQPRLDWQMWFAALGNINHNPWLVHLIQKILEGCEPVMDLVGAASPSMKQLQKIRGKLYHYDFTRLNTTWSRTIPGVEILPPSDDSNLLVPSKVWSRKLVHEYLPPVGTKELKEFLRLHGYKRYCVDPKQRCARHHANPWCPIATSIRQFRIYLLIPSTLVLLVLSRLWRRQRLVPRQDSPVTHKQKRGDSLEEKKNQ